MIKQTVETRLCSLLLDFHRHQRINACIPASDEEIVQQIIDIVRPAAEDIRKIIGKDGVPFIEYAEHVAMELYRESLGLLEGCDEPDFSAIDSINTACTEILRTAELWRQGKSQATAKTIKSDEAATPDCGKLTAELVRCRDCQYYTHSSWHRCDLYSIAHEVEPDGYCAWGERKEDGE